MKQSLVLPALTSACVFVVACVADEDPPPIEATGALGSMAGAGTTAPQGNAGAAAGGTANGGAPGVTAGTAGIGQGGSAGATAASGGADNTGGMAAGGAAGSAGSGGAEGEPELTLEALVGELDGNLFTVACGDTPNTDDCNGEGWRINGGPLTLCEGGRLEAEVDFPIGGEAGVVYDVAMHFYGIMEPRNYGDVVTREASGRPNIDEGGTPTPFAWMDPGANYLSTGDNNYNTYELHVFDDAGQEVQIYFLNADTQTGHYTMAISYEQTLQLIGGGFLRLQIADANCRQIKNCGSGGTPCSDKARSVDISAADPQPAANLLQQPGLGKDPEHSGQWFLLDVLSFQAQ